MKVYECRNKACSLGTVGQPGHFTGGISPLGIELLTGNREAPSGEGYCPNCGANGTPTKARFVPVERSDPHAEIHEEVAALVVAGKLDRAQAQQVVIEVIQNG